MELAAAREQHRQRQEESSEWSEASLCARNSGTRPLARGVFAFAHLAAHCRGLPQAGGNRLRNRCAWSVG